MTRLPAALRAISIFLDSRQIPYMVIGGIANLVWGVARTTLDIDMTVWAPGGKERELVDALCQTFAPLPPQPVEFVIATRVLPVKVEGFKVDVIFGGLPYEERALRRAREIKFDDFSVRVCSPEDLIVHKIVSERPRDREDIRGVLKSQRGKLDRAYMDPLVDGLAQDLAKPEIWEFYRSCLDEAAQ